MFNKMGVLFKDRIDDSPYRYSGQEIFATNPCSWCGDFGTSKKFRELLES